VPDHVHYALAIAAVRMQSVAAGYVAPLRAPGGSVVPDVRLAKVVACGDPRGHVAALVVRVAADSRAAMRLQTVLRLRWLCS
jgi:hypothetical protein